MGKRAIKKYKEKLKSKEYELDSISKKLADLSDDDIKNTYILQAEYDVVSYELDRLRDKPPKNRDFEKIQRKDRKIDDLDIILSKLEYQREDCLQQLNQLKIEEQELMQTLENAKIMKDVNLITGARANLVKVREKIAKIDKRLNKIVASITMKSMRKAKLQKTVIAEYEKYSKEYNIDERVAEISINVAKKEYNEQDETRREKQQRKYREDNLPEQMETNKSKPEPEKGKGQGSNTQPAKGNGQGSNTQPAKGNGQGSNTEPLMQRELDDERREELEKESIERYEEKRSSKKHVRLGRFFSRIWKRLTSIFALGANKLGRLANKGLLAAGNSLQKKLENDEDTYENRVDKFREKYRSTLSQAKQDEIAKRELEKMNTQNQEQENSNEL